jgi:pilus assembly protein CpaE
VKKSAVLIIDHAGSSNLKERLDKHTNFTVIGSTNSIDIGFTLAERNQPGIIIFNVDLPGEDGIKTAENLALKFPESSLVLMTCADSKRVLRHAMRVGAKEVINLPIEDDKLFRLLIRVVIEGMRRQDVATPESKTGSQFKTIAVFSTKGGVGKSTIALNTAIAIRKQTKKNTILLDLNLMSGNIALMAGVPAKTSIKDFIEDISNIDQESIDNYCVQHSSGLKILPAPVDPETASFITPKDTEAVLNLVSGIYNYVIIDVPNYFHDPIIPALESAKEIIVVTTLDLPSLQNLKQCLGILESLNMRSKARIVVNKTGNGATLRAKQLESELGISIEGVIPDCPKQALHAVDVGSPLVLSAKGSAAARAIEELASKLIHKEDSRPVSGWRRLLG